MKRWHARAFTLIELISVLAVVAILMAIVVPLLSKAKEHAKHSESISELHQIALASRIYLEDRDDVPPSIDEMLRLGLIPLALAQSSLDTSPEGIGSEVRKHNPTVPPGSYRISYVSLRDAVGEPILRRAYEGRNAGAYIDVSSARKTRGASWPLSVHGSYFRVLNDASVVRRQVPWKPVASDKIGREQQLAGNWFFSDDHLDAREFR
jgi:prepilin-type N-terminal cleavage/methylation domain-containing protein